MSITKIPPTLKLPPGLTALPEGETEFRRKCGQCTACCILPGINELRKKAGVVCKHLNTKIFGNQHCCTIYEKRPLACSGFHCAWILGLGPEATGRPDRSGLMVAMYLNNEQTELHATVTLMDLRRCGDFDDRDSMLSKFLTEIVATGINHVQVIHYESKLVILIKNGVIYRGELHPQKFYEDLEYQIFDPPIGGVAILSKLGESQ